MPALDVLADLTKLAMIRGFVAEAGRELDLEEPVISDLQLAVDEACTNIVKHGYGGRGGRIEITVEPVDEGIHVTIHDWGAAFDPQKVPLPDLMAPLEQRPLGGLGLLLIQRVMDQVDFEFDEENGNRLIMLKRIPRRAG